MDKKNVLIIGCMAHAGLIHAQIAKTPDVNFTYVNQDEVDRGSIRKLIERDISRIDLELINIRDKLHLSPALSGKEARRLRREKERKNNKRR